MARSAAAAGITGPCYVSHRSQSVFPDFLLDGPLRDEEARADQRFVSGPIVTRGVAVFTYGSQKRIARKRGAVFVVGHDSN